MASSPANLLAKPCPSGRPCPLHGLGRNAQSLRGFHEGEARKDPALDHATSAFVNQREMFEGLVNRQNLIDLPVGEERHLVANLESDRAVVTATLQTRAGPRVVDQNAPHRLRGDREEGIAIGSHELTLLHEPKVDLVDERSRGECMAGRFAVELSSRNLPQLVIDERYDSLRRFTIACAPSCEPLRDLTIGHHGATPTNTGVTGES